MLETSRVKGCLEGWREPVLHASSVLFWDKDWYPGVIAGALTAKFLFVWWWDPTLLSLLATTGFFLTLADYLGPKILAQVRDRQSQTSYSSMGPAPVAQSVALRFQKLTAGRTWIESPPGGG